MQILSFYFKRLAYILCFGYCQKSNDNEYELSVRRNESAPKCRTENCDFYGSSRTAGFCSVCYQKALGRKPSRIPILVSCPGVDHRYQRHLRELLASPQRDFLKKHDALIAELREKIKDNQEITPRLASSKAILAAGESSSSSGSMQKQVADQDDDRIATKNSTIVQSDAQQNGAKDELGNLIVDERLQKL